MNAGQRDGVVSSADKRLTKDGWRYERTATFASSTASKSASARMRASHAACSCDGRSR
jgi:hypothetical protein